MEQTSYIHRVLLKRSKEANWPYFSSILIRNENVPLFEEYFGQLDYAWLLQATKHRVCKETAPVVIRYVTRENLSRNPLYRKRDFYMGLLEADGDISVMKRWFSSRARYHYVMTEMKMARFFFLRGEINWKTVLYFISSYNKSLSRWIVKKYKVFG